MARNDDLHNLFKTFLNRIIFNQRCLLRSCFLNPGGKGSPKTVGSPPNSLFLELQNDKCHIRSCQHPSPPDTAEVPISWLPFPEETVRAPRPHGGWRALKITTAKWIALTKCNVLWQSPNMHFILEEQLKELVGNIKLSSVTAENNWVFCPVACNFVWCLRRLGSSVWRGCGRHLWYLWGIGVACWEVPCGCGGGCGSTPHSDGRGPWHQLRSLRIRTSQPKVTPPCSHFVDGKTESSRDNLASC